MPFPILIVILLAIISFQYWIRRLPNVDQFPVWSRSFLRSLSLSSDLLVQCKCHAVGTSITASEYRHTPEDDTDNQCSDCLGNVVKGNTADTCARICLLSLSDAHSRTVAPDLLKFAALDPLKTSDRPIEFLLDPLPISGCRKNSAFSYLESNIFVHIATARNVVPESEFLVLKCPLLENHFDLPAVIESCSHFARPWVGYPWGVCTGLRNCRSRSQRPRWHWSWGWHSIARSSNTLWDGCGALSSWKC